MADQDCCPGCDLVNDATTAGLIVHGHEDRGCALSAAQKVMLAARIEDQQKLLEQRGLIPLQ